MAHINTERVFAIDPTVKGYAFAVFEGPDTLLDWGIVQVLPKGKNRRCVRSIEEKLRRYLPSTLVFEDPEDRSSKRWPRVRRLIEEIDALSEKHGIVRRKVSRAKVRSTFAFLPKPDRTAIAEALARRFPELRSRLPRARKFWFEAEEERLNIFDAAALALTYLEGKAGRKQPEAAPAA